MSYYVESGWDFLNDSSGSSSPPSGGNGGGNGGGPAPSIDYGFDDSGGFIGEGWGGNPPEDPAPPVIETGPPSGGLDLSWATGSTAEQQAQIEADIALSTFSQPTETFAGTGEGSQYSGIGSPYFTSGYPDALWGSNVVPEQKPITNPSDMMIGNLLAYELSKDPKYGPGEKGEFVGPGSPSTNTLGKIMAVDSKGQMILDSSGNPIFTEFGKQMVDEFQANWDPSNPMDITLPGVFKEMAGDVIGKEKDFWEERRSFDDWWYDDPGTPWGQEWYDYPTDETQTAKLPHWRSEALPTGSVSMGEMQPIYGAEFGSELMASPLHVAGLESTTGIPYQGRPEFGTIEMPI